MRIVGPMNKKKSGKIDISKLINPPEKHELGAARFLASLGYDIEFIPPSNIPGVHRPDIIMQGIEWEIKCPKGKGKNTIQKNFKVAVKQSHFIIFDLRRVNIAEEKCISEIEKQMKLRPYMKRLLIVRKNETLLELPSGKTTLKND